VGARFSGQVESEASKLSGIAENLAGKAAQIADDFAGSAIEMSSLGEAFTLAVEVCSMTPMASSSKALITSSNR
jgi:hypothetical protein